MSARVILQRAVALARGWQIVAAQSRQKSWKRVGASSGYLNVC